MSSKPVLIICILLSIYTSSSHAQSCSSYTFTNNQVFSHCSDLPYLNSFLHWNYDESAKTVKIAYRHAGVAASRWVAWGLNPGGRGMVGTQALVAYQKSDGSMRAYTAPVTSYQTQLQEGDLSFPVSDLSATYANNEYTIFATLKVDNISSTVNQAWQEGPVSGDSPGIHPTSGANVQSAGNLNLLKVFPSADPAWFYLHALCQTSGYITGVAGWATGLQLGSQSAGIQYTAHRIIGIVIFCLDWNLGRSGSCRRGSGNLHMVCRREEEEIEHSP